VHNEFGPYSLLSTSSSPPASSVSPADASDLAIKYAAAKLGLSEGAFAVTNSYTSQHNSISHVYLQQVINDIPVANAFSNVNVDADGNIVSMGSSFYRDKDIPSPMRAVTMMQQGMPQQVFMVPSDAGSTLIDPSTALVYFAKHLHIEVDQDTINHEPIMSIKSFNAEANGPPRQQTYQINNVQFAEPKTVPAHLAYIQVVDPSTGKVELKLVWDLKVEMLNNWYHAHVDAVDGKIHSKVDWVADSQYTVLPLGINDPLSGDRITVANPENRKASPAGWNSQNSKNYTTTIGNNVYAQENLEGRGSWRDNYRPEGTEDLMFTYPFNPTKEPSSYVDAAITNLFYWNNVIHDLFYLYGFDEKAGNFQEFNHGRGGHGSDGVIANAQDGSGYNNANFATPPDGSHGKMRMYVWSESTPMRDGDLESGIIVHEYAHGISTRLTGGPANSGCLGWGESGGMGEGWGDFFATVFRHTKNTKRSDDFSMGEYANGGHGIRKFPYSESMKTNPSTYAYISKPGYWGVHAKGEVWAVILLEVYWELVEILGFDEDWYNIGKHSSGKHADGHDDFLNLVTGKRQPRVQVSSSSDDFEEMKNRKTQLRGNTLALQLVVDGMKLQPCYPSFVDARDAIIEADQVGFGGKHVCEIWKGFSKRGLGFGARSGGRESFEMPKNCERDFEEL